MEKKHSGFGIASFVLSLFAGFGMFVAICAAGVLAARNPQIFEGTSPVAIFTGLAIIAFGALGVLSLLFGIIGCCQKGRKRIFAILGTVFSGMLIFGTLFLMLLGLAAG